MCEYLKELGKHLLNLALFLAGALIIQPIVKGKFSFWIAMIGAIGYLSLLLLSYLLITRCSEED